MICARAARLRWLALLPIVLLAGSGCWLFEDDDRSYSALATDPEVEEPNEAPQISIESPARAVTTTVTEGTEMSLTAYVRDVDDNLSPDSVVWVSDLQGLLGRGPEVTSPALEVGIHQLRATATDDRGASASDSATLQVLPATYGGENAPPVVEITLPEPWAVYPEGGAIELVGDAVDPEEGPLPDDVLRWELDRRGEPEVVASGRAATPTLPGPGTWGVVLRASDPWGLYGVERRYVLAGPLGSCATTAPTLTPERQSVAPGALGTLDVVVAPRSDAPSAYVILQLEDGEDRLEDVVARASVEQRVLGGNSGLPRSVEIELRPDVTPGAVYSVNLALYYTNFGVPDLEPFVCRVPLAIDVVGGVPNERPTATISAPDDRSVFNQGAPVSFVGSATDAEDGPLSGASLRWESNLDGPLGTGSPLTAASLSVGEHTVTLTATDSGGLFARADRIVTIAPPGSTGTIVGRIFTVRYEGVSNEPGVTVTLTGPATRTAVSDSQGLFQFAGIPNGTYTVAVTSWPAWLDFPTESMTVVIDGNVVEASFQANYIGS